MQIVALRLIDLFEKLDVLIWLYSLKLLIGIEFDLSLKELKCRAYFHPEVLANKEELAPVQKSYE